jgi:hypothetical protein
LFIFDEVVRDWVGISGGVEKIKIDKRLISLVGPAGLIASKQINDLHLSETIGIPDVPLCLSHRVVSPEADKNTDFDPLEHFVYHGRQHLGRYTRIAPQRYAAYDANDCPLGEFRKRKDAWAAIGRSAAGARR